MVLTGLGLLGVLLCASPAHGQENAPTRHLDVVQVSGWIDPVVADFLTTSLRDSERTGAEALVIQLDSPGAVTDLGPLVRSIRRATVPVAVWVGSSADARGASARLVAAAPVVGLARGATAATRLPAFDGQVVLNRARSAVLGTFLVSLDGKRFHGQTIKTAILTPRKGAPPDARLDPDLQVRLGKLDLGPRMMHTAASPPVAYLLLAAGLALIVFELFTGGIGIAGGVGAVCLVLSAYGLAVLPTDPVGLGLILLSMFGFGVDVQTGVPRFWTGVGVVSFVVGSLLLYDDPVSLGWLPLVGGVVGVVLLMLAGLPATVRSRFSTPTIGRESMIGEVGEAVAALAPEGVVRVRDALWPARTNRATPLAVGDAVRVVGIDGASLEVAPDGPDEVAGGGFRRR
jgi:membrane-bound serine protease (ClpP class)